MLPQKARQADAIVVLKHTSIEPDAFKKCPKNEMCFQAVRIKAIPFAIVCGRFWFFWFFVVFRRGPCVYVIILLYGILKTRL